MRSNYLFTSESVSEGHPDKVSDQISDAIVDLFLSKDPEARIACETLTTTQLVVLAGEIRCKGVYENGEWAPGAEAEIEDTVRATVKRIGYEQSGFHWQTFAFENHLHAQSAHIAQGVDEKGNKDEGAGDQGIMFGFACDETPDLMPATLYYSHKILERMAADRHSGAAPFLQPDAKSQVTLRFENGKPAAAAVVVVSTQHAAGYDEGEKEAELHAYVKQVVADVIPAHLLSEATQYHINPTGSFEIGGPDGDAGLTGRKIIVDTYGGAAPHGGGAFSGKDPTKVDRSAAYVTRYMAKNVVAAGLARRCTIQLSYAIGVAEPLSLYVDLHGTELNGATAERLEQVLPTLVRLTPKGIRTHLGLNKPIYEKTAAYGHFGRKPEGDLFSWEKTDLVDRLKQAVYRPAMTAGANLYGLFAAAADAAGETPVFVEDGRVVLRYAALDAAVAGWADALHRRGARPGDRILVQAEKSVEAALLYLACLRAGLIYVPLNPAYTPAELAWFVADAEPVLVVDDATLGEIAVGISPGAEAKIEPRGPDDLAAILYTSGTTGRSKGAMLSHDNLASNALVLKEAWRWQPGDVLIHALPIYHVHGLFVALHGALLNGSTMRWHRTFDAGAVIGDMARATILMGVPTFYVRLAADPRLTRAAAASMRLFVSGSAPLLAATFADFEAKTGHLILERYGMTEAGMICSNPYDGPRIPGTVGFPLPGIDARVADGEGRELPCGEPGVLEIKGPNLFKGYWRQPEKTVEEMRPDGHFITGDIATMDEEGRVAIVGRAKDLIIAGGLNIYPKEIELAIDALPGVGESAVIGVPHPDLGEAAIAVVVRTDPALDEAAIIAGIADLARFKQPRRILFADALPRNAMGKVQKAALRAAHAHLFAD